MTSRSNGGIRERTEDGALVAPIFETTDFALYVGSWPAGLWEGQIGYLLFNKRHDMCEAIMGSEALGILEARQQQEILDRVRSNEYQEDTDDDREFQMMIQRLQGKQPKH